MLPRNAGDRGSIHRWGTDFFGPCDINIDISDQLLLFLAENLWEQKYEYFGIS